MGLFAFMLLKHVDKKALLWEESENNLWNKKRTERKTEKFVLKGYYEGGWKVKK